MKRIQVAAAIALLFCPIFANAATVAWSAVGANQVGAADGSAATDGWLLRVGAFDVSNSVITANSSNLAFLNSHFIEFGAGSFGNTGLTSGNIGAWEIVSVADTSDLGPSHLNIEIDAIYIWALNASSFGAANQHLIVSSSLSNWTFPAQAAFPNSTAIDLGDLTNGAGTSLLPSAHLLAGSFGPQMGAGGGALFLMVAAIPEPATLALILLPLPFLAARRRRTQQ